jgi:hypothetical protein
VPKKEKEEDESVKERRKYVANKKEGLLLDSD